MNIFPSQATNYHINDEEIGTSTALRADKSKDDIYPVTVTPLNYMENDGKYLHPDVWGPHYWFFLHTIAFSYPENPNEFTKRKYYDLIHNFPLFIPDNKIGDNFNNLLINYPVTPYLCSRESFMKWVFFIHNKINYSIGKPEISYLDSLELYLKNYESEPVKMQNRFKLKRKYIIIFIILFFIIGFYFYFRTSQ